MQPSDRLPTGPGRPRPVDAGHGAPTLEARSSTSVLDSSEAIKRSVRAGLGIGFVSRLEVSEELERGELEAFAVAGVEPMKRSVFLLRPDGRDPVPAERAFIETLRGCLAKHAH